MELGKIVSPMFAIQAIVLLFLLILPTIGIDLASFKIVVVLWLIVIDLVIVVTIISESPPVSEDIFMGIMLIAQALIAGIVFFYASSDLTNWIFGLLLLCSLVGSILLWISSEIPRDQRSIALLLNKMEQVSAQNKEENIHHEQKLEEELDLAVEKIQETVSELKDTIPLAEEHIRIASAKGKNYHRLTCLAMAKVSKADRRTFELEKFALKAGLKACRICLPTVE